MLLKQINFHNFRNFAKAQFIFNPFLTIVIGENSRGKTNLLEGIYFLIAGSGFRETKENELILLGSESSLVEGMFNQEDMNFHFKITLSRKTEGTEKKFNVDKTRKRHSQYVTHLTKAVLFSPEQIDIIIGAPNIRRNYFDKLISIFDFDYKGYLDNYENALRRRNKILEKYRDETQLKEELVFWNNYLLKQAAPLTKKRRDYIDYLNSHQKLNNKSFRINYLKNEFSEKRLTEVFTEEMHWRRTLIGPQKDDFQIILLNSTEKDVHAYGSRSEQRMALFWLKINEINYCEEKIKVKPIILLDDIFSEFDSHHKKLILNLVAKYQTIVTTTENEVLEMTEVPKTVIKF